MRRRSGSDLSLLLGVVSRLPWWLCIALAAVSFIALRIASSATPAAPADLAGFSEFVSGQILLTAARLGQVVVPVIFIIGAALSIAGRVRGARLTADFARSEAVPATLGWQDFETVVAEIFRGRGYRVEQTRGGTDGGIDLVVRREGEAVLVQCKHWRARSVGVAVVRELKGVVAEAGAAGGVVVTSGYFTNDAKRFAERAGIELMDGPALAAVARRRAVPAETEPTPDNSDVGEPACPRCRSTMVRRVARRGEKQGQAFWGCSHFPRCTGTRDI